jgi:excinuclease ABC subunit A
MPKNSVLSLDPKQYIIINGARVHNLKNIDVAIPRNQMVVITGLSGSGKSSLAFDTLYAEGQRRYVESLSSYARQFMGRLDKPDVDNIKGIAPAIAIEQKVNSKNPRSTVGTNTEIYDYLKLLFARVGTTYSPVSGDEVKRHTVTDIIRYLNKFEKGTKAILYSPLKVMKDRTVEKQLEILLQQGYTRLKLNDKVERIDALLESKAKVKGDLLIVIDRFAINAEDDSNNSRIADSAEIAFFEGDGTCIVEVFTEKKNVIESFSNRFELDGILFEEPSEHFFTFNNPVGACKSCEGFGSVIGIDKDLVIPNKNLSIFEDAVVCWKGEKMGKWKEKLVTNSHQFDFPVHRPYHDLTPEEQELLWTGNKHFKGLNAFFKHIESKLYKIQYRVMLSRYRGKTICPECYGTRLRKDANYVKIGGKSLSELVTISVDQCLEFFKTVELTKHQQTIAKRILVEITNRLGYLCDVGLGYLTLNRLSSTLSGGESQRINLSTSIGSSLVGSMYILDEPSIGLHPRDTKRLITVLKSLKKVGNTVIIVEHEEEIMREADQLIDMGPMAGTLGGEVVFQGTHKDLISEKKSLTALYLTGRESIEIPAKRRKWKHSIEIKGARENNLKGFDVKIPLGALTVITGVSGSGKTSLVKTILYPALKKMHGGYGSRTGYFDRLEGDLNQLRSVEFIDQNPIGKSSRSNPVTYVKAFDEIRALFAAQQLSKVRGYKPSHFSFNVAGGRCDNCDGEGEETVEMQFMADVKLQCEVCKGRRFKDDIIEVTFREKSIFDVLNLTIDDAMDFFQAGKMTTPEKKIVTKLKPLQDVGLGYVKLGQSSSTLSGGEAQRIKLASFLGKGKVDDHTLFIFDEPTTGLHFHDIKKLLYAVNALVDKGHTVLIIEHDPDMIKCADWIIDLGPEGGDAGGNLVFEGTPEDIVNCKGSYTGEYLKGRFEGVKAL